MSDVLNRHSETQHSRREFLGLSGTAALVAAGAMLPRVGFAFPPESDKTIRLGVVGGNFGARFHFHEHPNCKVTGVTDLISERREKLKIAYRCDTVYDSLEQMVQQAQDIDAVAIFSEAPKHEAHVRMCMERGWHVLSACPACISVEEAERLVEVQKRTGMTYMMAESSYYRQECIFARNLFEAGKFGNLFYSEVEYYHDRGDVHDKNSRFYNPDGTRSWRWGYPPMLYPTHSLGLLVGVTGERVVKVSCMGWATDDPYLNEGVYGKTFWNQAALMQTNRGNMCRCNVFWKCTSDGERAQWFGDLGTLYMHNEGVNDDIVMYEPKHGISAKVPQFWKTAEMLPQKMRHQSGHGGSAVFLSAEFINALLEARTPSVDLPTSLAMTVPGIIAHQSSLRGGELLDVPQFDT